MSIEAITYAKSLDVTNPMSRLLLFIIGENTFNDSGLCRVGQKVLSHETRASVRTVRTHLDKLEAAGVIKIKAQPKASGGRANDAIELVGFLEWLAHARKQPEPAKSSPSAEPAKNTASPVQSGKQVAGSNKEQSRTSQSVRQRPTNPTAPSERFLPGAGDRLIPFSGTEVENLLDAGQKAAAAQRNAKGSPEKMPFSAAVLRQVAMIGVQVGPLVDRYLEKTKGKHVRDPSAYLLTMARDELAKREGVSVELVKCAGERDREIRALAQAAIVSDGPRALGDVLADLGSNVRKRGAMACQQ